MMPKNRNTDNGERGQALILFSFMIVVLLICVMAVVDVGFFLHAREQAQQTADAAALAGAQELPGDPVDAQAVALDYVQRNGLDPASVTVSFACTSNTPNICMDGDGRYDTIRVTPRVNSPTFFGSVLAFIGVDSCWVEGCDAQASAAGCRGACGPIGTGPADIMTVLDHSLSMSTTDLSNAKGAISSMFTDFNYQYQKVGLTEMPGLNPSNLCQTANSVFGPYTWMAAQLTNTFQTSPHVLNNSSPPVQYAACAPRPGYGQFLDYPLGYGHTDVGSPLKAAADELAANGRPDVTWGIILVTDGAANQAPFVATTTTGTDTNSTNTGWRDCTSTQAVNSSAGDNNGYESSPGNGCNDNNNRANDANSGTNTSTTCTDTGKDKHRFYNYGFSFPSGSGTSNVIDGIEVRLKGYANSTSSTKFCVELSWDGGTNWTDPKSVNITSTSETAYVLGASNDNWGHSWTTGELSNSNFRIRVTNVANSTARTFTMDAVQARVSYTTTSTTTSTTYSWDNSLGPCDYAMQQASAAKALGIEVYTIGFGLDPNERCRDNGGELSSSPYYNYTAAQLLTAMATDAGHFYNAPKNEDLTGIFAAIGAQLTGGSRLVE